MKTTPRNTSHSFEVVRAAKRWATLVWSVLMFLGCATGPTVAPNLRVPAEQKPFLHAFAKGVQIYSCEASSTEPAKFSWKLKAPEAMLFTECGRVIGSHYAGPTWECDRDGSKVVGTVLQRSAAPGSNAIPWLLLQAKATAGAGEFEHVSYVQRVNTSGGLAPTTGADAAQRGQEVRVPYTAEYYFYRAKQ